MQGSSSVCQAVPGVSTPPIRSHSSPPKAQPRPVHAKYKHHMCRLFVVALSSYLFFPPILRLTSDQTDTQTMGQQPTLPSLTRPVKAEELLREERREHDCTPCRLVGTLTDNLSLTSLSPRIHTHSLSLARAYAHLPGSSLTLATH